MKVWQNDLFISLGPGLTCFLQVPNLRGTGCGGFYLQIMADATLVLVRRLMTLQSPQKWWVLGVRDMPAWSLNLAPKPEVLFMFYYSILLKLHLWGT